MAAEYCSAETQNKAIVIKLYAAVAAGDTQMVAGVVAGDLEWWFHGPPRCHHMMRVLTGESPAYAAEFMFEPRSITAIDEACVIAEGWEGGQAYWVHVWTLKGGRITQFREYFNTWLTVKDVRPADWLRRNSPPTPTPTLWRSQQPLDLFKRSLPGLLLAI